MGHEYHSYYYGSSGREPVSDAYRMPRGTEMTPELLSGLIEEFRREHVPRYRFLNAPWERKFEIFGRPGKPDWKPDNRLAVNYPRAITKAFEGYFIGIPVTVRHPDAAQDDWLQAYIRRVGQADVDADVSESCSKYGNGFEYLHQREDGLPWSAAVSPLTAFVVYDDTMAAEPLFGVIFGYGEDGRLSGTLCDAWGVSGFSDGGSGIEIAEPLPHYFGGVPLVEYVQDNHREGLYEGVLNLCDALNRCLSEKANDVEYFADAYLAVTGMKLPEDFKKDLRKYRIINVWGDNGGQVDFMGKPDGDATQENLLNRLETLIYKSSMIPDITDESYYTASGSALKKRLMPMSNLAITKERKFEASVRRRLKLLAAYPSHPFTGWEDVEVTMHRNLPDDREAEVEMTRSLSGLVSERTRLSLLSFVKDPDEEIGRMAREKEERAAATGGGWFGRGSEEER